MSKLIVLSNRVNLPSAEKNAAGGLAVALQDALREIGGVWVGWNGEKIDNSAPQQFNNIHVDHVEYLTCPLTEQQYDQYYCGFANNVLWPAMHERLDLVEYNEDEYKTYQKVNRLFAEELKKVAHPDDMIWVHDYHFFSVAAHCRDLGMKNRLGYFLHIPFAQQDMWDALPVAQELIEHLCEFDVIGLQTEQDQNKCMDICHHYIRNQTESGETLQSKIMAEPIIHTKTAQTSIPHNTVNADMESPHRLHFDYSNFLKYKNRIIKIECYPIGVNPELIQKVASSNGHISIEDIFNMDHSTASQTIISVDRIDYSKGMLERFNAFADFLKLHPEYHQLVTDLQIACPCRMDIPAYEDLYNNVQAKVSEINQQYTQGNWSPINCTHDTVDHEQLMKVYRESDICWVNSLKDGMNLVAKEYVAAQDEQNPGVLILSKYAGSAEQMSEAIIVDPNDPQSMIDALSQALTMDKSERVERYDDLLKGLKRFDIHHWRNAFLKDLEMMDKKQLDDTKLPQASNIGQSHIQN